MEPFAAEAVRLITSAEASGEGARPWIAAMAKGQLAPAFMHQRRVAEGRLLFDEAAAQARGIGETILLGLIRIGAGMGAMLQGDLAEATAALMEGANACRETGALYLSTPLNGLGEIALRAGDGPGAAGHLREALRAARAIGYRRDVAETLLDFGLLARMVNQPERSARLFGAAEALRGALGQQVSLRQRGRYQETVSAVQAAVGNANFEQAWANGRAMTLEEAVAYALEEGGG
jgi:hypothetical protein